MGRISSQLTFSGEAADISFETDFHSPPRHLVIPSPYFVELDGFETDATESTLAEGLIKSTPPKPAPEQWFRPQSGGDSAGVLGETILEAMVRPA